MARKAGTTGQSLAGLSGGVRGGGVNARRISRGNAAIAIEPGPEAKLFADASSGEEPPLVVVDRPLGDIPADVSAPQDDSGIRCPGCGCRDLRVYYTRPLSGGRIRRVRICRYCAKRVMTTEKLS